MKRSHEYTISTKIQKKIQKQLFRDVPRKRCSENMQQIYRRTPMSNCDFNNVAELWFCLKNSVLVLVGPV